MDKNKDREKDEKEEKRKEGGSMENIEKRLKKNDTKTKNN